uniref:putative nuclease HARBI1 isoform X2 n=1 Tax=Epinephelus lanceolatus TaxID=310571 RepID=UPI001446DBD6|nr:putative nuclease HARBI1 isoform X2 [Epinephelus lanceolatus]
MSKVQMLRSLVKQRLTAAAEEIFGLFERTIAEYEEELCRSKEENERQRKRLDAVFNPQPQLNKADIQQLSVVKEEVPPEQQEWSSSVDQEDPEPPHIKREQEELWISQVEEQLQGLEEDDIIKFTSTPVPVKSEDDEEKPQSLQLHQRHTEQMETEAEGEDCVGAEPARNSDPDTHLQPETVDKTRESSEPETDDSDDWKETRKPHEMEYTLAQRIQRRRRQQVYRLRTTYLNITEEECRRKLHLSRQAVTEICHLLSADLETHANTPYTLPVAVKVTAALYFFASGSFQHPLSSIGGISQRAMSSAIHAVTSGLVRHASEFIQFPMTPDSQNRVKQEFWARFGFPGVLGAIDCTHVQLRAPTQNAVIYINRKGTHSINVQVICDAACKVIHVFANYPGSSHDSFILANSVIPAVFQGDPPLEGWLLGDNGYPLKTWLITPYIMPTTLRASSFNQKHTKARSVIERTFGMLKMRFRCLDKSGGTLQYSPQKVGAFFVACCVLHNLAIRHGCLLDQNEDTVQDLQRREAELHVPLPINPNTPAAARARRDQLAEELHHL